MNESKLWTRDFLLDTMINFTLYFAHFLPLVTIAVYAADHFQASASEAGLASGIYIIGGLIARTLTGRVIDRIGRKKTLYFGLCFFLMTTLLYFCAKNSLMLLFLVRFLHGVGWGISATATATIIANIIPIKRLGEGTGYYALSVTVASAIGPLTAMLVIERASFDMMINLTLVLAIINLITAFLLNVPEAKLTENQLDEMKGWKLDNFFEAKAVPISIVAIFMGIGVASVVQFLSSYVRAIDLADAGSFFFLVYAMAMLISRPFTGRWFDSKGENFVIYPSFLLFALGLIILSLANQGAILFLAAILTGVGFGTFASSAQALSVKLSPRHRTGLATSTYFSLLDIGAGIGPVFLGLLIPVTGFRGLYVSVAVIVLFCIVLYYFLHGRKVREE